MKNIITIILLGISIISTSFAQDNNEKPSGYFSLSIAYSVKDDLLPEGIDYSPIVFLASFPIYQKRRWAIYSELQYAKAMQGYKFQAEWEFGMNVGFMYRFLVLDKFSTTLAIGTGPYFISLETSRQARGFIFSDNLQLGFVYPISKMDLDLNIKARYRHISNAGFESPNGGIENMFFVFGITKHFF